MFELELTGKLIFIYTFVRAISVCSFSGGQDKRNFIPDLKEHLYQPLLNGTKPLSHAETPTGKITTADMLWIFYL